MGAAAENVLSVAGSVSLLTWAGHLVAVWILGIVLGWLLPRPKWVRRNSFLPASPSLWLGRVAVAFNALLLVREVWYRFCHPGTFRALVRATWESVTQGEPLRWPQLSDASDAAAQAASADGTLAADPLRWYITTADLEHFKDVVERGAGNAWEQMFSKTWDGVSYTAWRRMAANGRTEYKSVTVAEDSTAQEFMDFYLDDDTRPKWDGMITSHDLLEAPPSLAQHRCQVVRWLRSFPFAFISRREYVIARRVFPGDSPDVTYAVTRSVEHPAAPRAEEGLVRMENYYSMWRSRTVPCPSGTSRPACETTLLHFEDFGIPEHLARFAVRHGMAGFVAKMTSHVPGFVAERRARCAPTAADPRPYGYNLQPLMCHDTAGAALALTLAADSAAGSARPTRCTRSSPSLSSFADDSASERSGRIPRPPSMRGLGYMLLASGVAIALSRTPSAPNLAAADAAPAERERAGRHGKHAHPRHRHSHSAAAPDAKHQGPRSHKLAGLVRHSVAAVGRERTRRRHV